MTKQNWDTRAWIIGIVGGAIGGGLAAWSLHPMSQRRLDALPQLAPFGFSNGQTVSILLGVLNAFILPGLVSGIARRRTFFWGLLPLTLFVTTRNIEFWIQSGVNEVVTNSGFSLSTIGICLLLSSGPVSFIRWLRVRATRHHAAVLESYQEQREAGSVPRDGVWPPPPEYQE